MPKDDPESAEPLVSGAEQLEDVHEDGADALLLRATSRESSLIEGEQDVQDFADEYGFSNEDRELLLRAAHSLHQDNDHISHLAQSEQEAQDHETTHKWCQPWTLYFTIAVCSLGAIEQGWAQTGMNGANLHLPRAMGIDSGSTRDALILGLLNCGLYLANACWGSWLSEPINRVIGRRGAVAVANVFCLLGNLGSGISESWHMLLAMRLLLGTGMGLNASTVSILAAESAPPTIRGGLATSWQMFTAFGIFGGFLANVAVYGAGEDVIWRYQLAAPLLPTLPLLACIYLCPESSAWQFRRRQYLEGFSSLVRLRNTRLQAARETFSSYLLHQKGMKAKKSSQESFLSKVGALFSVPRNRHAMYASYTVMLAQQICGINIIAFYSSTIFSCSNFSPLAVLWASVIFGLVNFLGAFPAIWTMDSFGRRRLLLWTLPPMALVMALTGLTFTLPSSTSQFVLLAGLIYLFCAIYSPGMGPVPVAYSAEVYPPEVREVGMSFAISTASTWATVLSLTFPALLKGIGETATFELYAVLNVVAWLLCWLFVREVKGVRLEDMDAVFASSSRTFVKEMWADPSGVRHRLSGRAKSGEGWLPVEQSEYDD